MTQPIVGILVGGQGRRMGGVAKGLLRYQGQPLLDRLVDACRRAVAPAELRRVCLIGNAAAYGATRLPVLADEPPGLGPIGGLRALLLDAARSGHDAIALAVDLPYVTPGLIRRLCVEQAGAAALAPRETDLLWQPLFARYRPEPVLRAIDAVLDARRSSLQSIFEVLASGADRAVELALTSDERATLRDWDRPNDMEAPAREP